MPTDHPAHVFVPVLKDMVEGRMEAVAWFRWLDENAEAIQAAVPPGWWLRLKAAPEESINYKASRAVQGISYVLKAMNVPHEVTDRHAQAWDLEFREKMKKADSQRKKAEMANQKEIKKWAGYFRAFGAEDPEGWARSQVEEGIPQYARLVFLWQAWKNVVGEGDVKWIKPRITEAERHPRAPGAGIGPALKRLLAAGASREDITEVVRVMQWELLHHIAYQLADPGIVDYPSDDLPRVNWTLFEVDEDGQPLHDIDCLHESVLDTDPSGREMRPKGVGREG